MGFYLHIEVDWSLSPSEFRERIIIPLREALEREELGSLLDGDSEDEPPEGVYELALEVTDLDRARVIVEKVLKAVDD